MRTERQFQVGRRPRRILPVAVLTAAGLVAVGFQLSASTELSALTLPSEARDGVAAAQVYSKKKKQVRRGSHSTTSTSTTGTAPVDK